MRGMQVTRRNLEQLRAIKTRMVRLFTKVETIRELLERLLNDDDDMRDMNLTAKCVLPPSVTCFVHGDGRFRLAARSARVDVDSSAISTGRSCRSVSNENASGVVIQSSASICA